MKKISSISELKESILLLETQQAEEKESLSEQFKLTCNSLKPANLIKNTIHDLVTAPDLKQDLLGTAIGLTAGYLSKKVIVGSTINPIKLILGNVLQYGVSNLVSRNSEGIKSAGRGLIGRLFRKKKATTTT